MTDAASAVSSSPAAPGRRKTLLLRIVAGLALAGAAYGAWWGLVARHYQHTDNAYVGGNLVQITPQTSGTVLSILADDTDFVAAGQPLVKLDPADAEVALAQAEADLAQQVRQSRALFANRAASAALLAQRQSELSRAEDVLKRWQAAGGEAVAGEELAHASAAVANARAALSAAKEQLAASAAQTENASPENHPAVARAAARVREAYLALSRATLPAPVAGYVAKRGVQVGQRVQPGAPLMAIVPLNSLWVDANFKESQLAGMRIGQPVTLHADIYGGSVTYHGKVAGLGAGTGGVFSLLPAQNATGNWIKVVQRVPVRITLDPKELSEHPLRVGLSMLAEVDQHDPSGPALATAPRQAPAQSTTAFAGADQAAQARIARIIADNLGKDRS